MYILYITAAQEIKDGFVKLKLMIDGLKLKKNRILRFGNRAPKGKNARIDEPIFTERYFIIREHGYCSM